MKSEETIRKNLAINLRIARVKKFLSQEKLAELVDISSKHIVKIEHANVTPSIYLVYKLASALNISVDKLLSDVED